MNKSDFNKLQKALKIVLSVNSNFSGTALESYRLEEICAEFNSLLSGSEL